MAATAGSTTKRRPYRAPCTRAACSNLSPVAQGAGGPTGRAVEANTARRPESGLRSSRSTAGIRDPVRPFRPDAPPKPPQFPRHLTPRSPALTQKSGPQVSAPSSLRSRTAQSASPHPARPCSPCPRLKSLGGSADRRRRPRQTRRAGWIASGRATTRSRSRRGRCDLGTRWCSAGGQSRRTRPGRANRASSRRRSTSSARR